MTQKKKDLIRYALISLGIIWLGVILWGCASVSTVPSTLKLEEPVKADRVVKTGPSYGCDTREVTVDNPMDLKIVTLIGCKCKEPTEMTIEPHTVVTVRVSADKSLNGNNQCDFTWAIAGLSYPRVISQQGVVP